MTTTSASSPPETTVTRSVHMIRAELDVNAFHRWAGTRGLISRNAFDEGFAMHCLLVESFGDIAPKPFRVIIPRDRRRSGVLYGYCQSDADALREAAAAYADPLQGKILPATRIDSKAMPSSWERGRRLGFEVLVRPIVRPARGGTTSGQRDRRVPTGGVQAPEGRYGTHQGKRLHRLAGRQAAWTRRAAEGGEVDVIPEGANRPQPANPRNRGSSCCDARDPHRHRPVRLSMLGGPRHRPAQGLRVWDASPASRNQFEWSMRILTSRVAP